MGRKDLERQCSVRSEAGHAESLCSKPKTGGLRHKTTHEGSALERSPWLDYRFDLVDLIGIEPMTSSMPWNE